ncbi:MAG: glycosyltransferase [Solirubrobacteraceae bacterium]
MHVLFDAYWWIDGPASNHQVLRDLVGAWFAEFPTDQATLVVPRKHQAAARAELPDHIDLMPAYLKPHGVSAAVEMPMLARRVRADVTLTHNFAPVIGTSGVFIQDVLFQTNPEWFTRAERLYLALIPLLAPRANVIFASTHCERGRIREHNQRIARVVPVGLAVGSELRDATPQRPSVMRDNQPFLLSVGRLNVRKNLAFTVSAALESGAISASTPLIVVGEREGMATDLANNFRAAISSGVVRLVGRVTPAELAWLYSRAAGFVYLSLDEGFGLPPIEALAFGCPVLVSDIPVFRETLGARGEFVSPTDGQAAAIAISELVKRGNRTRPHTDSVYTWPAVAKTIRAELKSTIVTSSSQRWGRGHGTK